MNIISAVKNNYGKYLAKTAGAAALYFIARDAHTIGKLQADVTSSTNDANVSMDLFENSQRLDSPSLLKSEVKDKVFKYHLGSNMLSFFNSAIGYFSGVCSMLCNDVVPLALSATALLAKGKKLACGSAIALAAYSGLSFIKDGLGLGTTKFLQK
ncbi:hypothetical protein KID03_06170 [bacterium]|uniref:Uncharacterized protein n=1 Tax=Candidatus Scatenecus faecavium TaxID=2840915 RepID=A0A9D1FV76_9BACT|nr:hypothetical protein [bacterium]HIS82625.1 hypothetical protein [Candidatus Scatenecus faecavium]